MIGGEGGKRGGDRDAGGGGGEVERRRMGGSRGRRVSGERSEGKVERWG